MTTLLWVIVFILALFFGWLVYLTINLQKTLNKMGILFSGNDTKNLGEQLKKYATEVKAVEDHCFKLDKAIKDEAEKTKLSLIKKGFVRYNPFGDVGGNQSFSLALLDEGEDGYVISSIHSREGTRVYAKTVEKGKSEYNLSQEEQKAIELARGGQ